MVIRRVGPLSFAKIVAAIYVLAGFVMGGILSLFSWVGGLTTVGFALDPVRRPVFPAFMGSAAILVLPILYGALGFVTSLVSAWLYNIVARVVGGIEIDLA